MTYRIAKTLAVLRDQVDARWPGRSKASDGWIGNAAHASRKSDHNPWVRDGSTGVVTALDITHDPAHGLDAGALAEQLRLSHDPRIKYVISNARMARSYPRGNTPAWAWTPYTGPNAHRKHLHLSVRPEKTFYDLVAPWPLQPRPVAPGTVPLPLIPSTKDLQELLVANGYKPGPIDGVLGPRTKAALEAFQEAHKLPVGPADTKTWAALSAAKAPGKPKAVTPAPTTPEPVPAATGQPGPNGEPPGYFEGPLHGRDILMDKAAWPKHWAAAAMGHAMQEDYADLRQDVWGDHDTAYGLMQWRGPRLLALIKWATSRGRPRDDFESQVLFIPEELRTTEREAWGKLQLAKDVEEATEALMFYERPQHFDRANPRAGHGWSNRLRNAKSLMT